MLVDGTLVASDTGRTFANVNPATEEVLGQVADGSAADMHRAIDAARRAFDESGWSTDLELRKRCLSQLQDALEKERAARGAHPRGGLPAPDHPRRSIRHWAGTWNRRSSPTSTTP
jgi:acyl-CoA reductase-like NAD-dependent aldehyde dehydrogenase